MRNRLFAVMGLALLLAALVSLVFWQLSRTGSAPPAEEARVGSAAPAAGSPTGPAPPAEEPRVSSVAPAEESPTGPARPENTPQPKTRGSIGLGVPTPTAAIPAFPWPPPAASAEHQIRNAWVSKGEHTKLSDVAEKLEAALEDADYETWRYSSVPRGFALVTQIEQIKPDGTPRSGKQRFRADLPSLSDMTFVEFLKALAKAPPGYYRVIVFIVTDTPFSRADKRPSADEARRWLDAGLNQLPKSMGVLTYEEDYRTTALIYEFKKPSKNDPATFVPKSLESGKNHLEKARIWDALTR